MPTSSTTGRRRGRPGTADLPRRAQLVAAFDQLFIAASPAAGHPVARAGQPYRLAVQRVDGHFDPLAVRADALGPRLARHFDPRAPGDVLMPGGTPVQPDALFLANDNPAEIDEDHFIRGVPDLVVEVASPSTTGYDRREKQDLYARAGVREYWYVAPSDVTIELLVLDGARRAYRSLGVFPRQSRLPSTALGELPFTVGEMLE